MLQKDRELLENVIAALESNNDNAECETFLRGVLAAIAEKAPLPPLLALAKFVARSQFDENVG